ncbi:MAG: hypothetical protein HC902_13210 [Calothrix sp. SM1_5_4]|nr:hypothetical protein [Calothrix sp. SM1_5_4]
MSLRTHFKNLLLLGLLSMAGARASAGLLIEPAGGYSVGDRTLKVSDTHPDTGLRGAELSGSVDGLVYGGRVGWLFGRFFLGGDYQLIRGKQNLNQNAALTDFNMTTMYGTLGVWFNPGFRIFAAKAFEHKSVEENRPHPTTYKGDGYKVGLSYAYRMMPLAINVEYAVFEYKKAEINGVEYAAEDLFSSQKFSTLILSISLPFRF